MDRKLFGLFSGTHLTLVVLGAMLAPSVLYGAITYSNVAVVNPTTGTSASVDSAGRLTAINPYSYYKDYAANAISITVSNTGSECETSQDWTVPSGKAFIITAMSGWEYAYANGDGFTGFNLWSGAGCTGHLLTSDISNAPSSATAAYAPVRIEYGIGVPAPGGSTISLQSINDGGYTFIHGYLVPAAWVTASQHIGPSENPSAKWAALKR